MKGFFAEVLYLRIVQDVSPMHRLLFFFSHLLRLLNISIQIKCRFYNLKITGNKYGHPAGEKMGTAGIGAEDDFSIYTIPQLSMII